MYQPGVAAYKRMEVNTVEDPKRLVYMLFERAIQELRLAERNLESPRKRDSHLGKVIAILGELQAGINFEAGEAAQFLFGLYGAIIKELSKVKGPEHKEIIERSIRYLAELKKIWGEQVLGKSA